MILRDGDINISNFESTSTLNVKDVKDDNEKDERVKSTSKFITLDHNWRNYNKDNNQKKVDYGGWMKCHSNKDVYISPRVTWGQILDTLVHKVFRSF